MSSHNNTKHRQETVADMWARGEAVKEFSRSWPCATPPRRRSFASCSCSAVILAWSVSVVFFQAVNSFCVGPISCYQFSSDQPFITRSQGWLPEGELPALVAGLYICLSPAAPPLPLLSCPHAVSLIYLPFENASSLFTSSSEILLIHLLQPSRLSLSPVSVCLSSNLSPGYLCW